MHPSGGPYGRMFGVHANIAGRNREKGRKKKGCKTAETKKGNEQDRRVKRIEMARTKDEEEMS